MRRMLGYATGMVSVLWPALALAEGAGGGYRGIAQIYYTLIAAILIYGVYDVFGKKATYFIGPLIVVGMYLMLPKT